MAELSFKADQKLADKTLAAIEAAVVSKATAEGPRPHLGASEVGHACSRYLWLKFHWAAIKIHDGRMYRLFERGHREEQNLAQLLNKAGVTVQLVDPLTGQQWRFSDGHFQGSMDGKAIGVLEAPKTVHILEFKTSSKKAFDELVKCGVRKSKPMHFAQMQVYMHYTGLTRALYMAVCKDDDRLHMERVDFDKEVADSFVARAHSIIDAAEPPERVGDATWYECRYCDMKDVCHGTQAPEPNCRTCAHSTAEKNGSWTCAGYQCTLDYQQQRSGCAEHRYIPALIKHWAEVVNANHEQNWVEYVHTASKSHFINGPGPDGFSSKEIFAAADKAGLGMIAADEYLMNLRRNFGGEVVG